MSRKREGLGTCRSVLMRMDLEACAQCQARVHKTLSQPVWAYACNGSVAFLVYGVRKLMGMMLYAYGINRDISGIACPPGRLLSARNGHRIWNNQVALHRGVTGAAMAPTEVMSGIGACVGRPGWTVDVHAELADWVPTHLSTPALLELKVQAASVRPEHGNDRLPQELYDKCRRAELHGHAALMQLDELLNPSLPNGQKIYSYSDRPMLLMCRTVGERRALHLYHGHKVVDPDRYREDLNPVSAVPALQELALGHIGIFDHDVVAKGRRGRISSRSKGWIAMSLSDIDDRETATAMADLMAVEAITKAL